MHNLQLLQQQAAKLNKALANANATALEANASYIKTQRGLAQRLKDGFITTESYNTALANVIANMSHELSNHAAKITALNAQLHTVEKMLASC